MNTLLKHLLLLDGAIAAPAFVPTDLASLRAWYDASQIEGLGDGDTLTGWDDSGSNGYDMTVSAGNPIYKVNIQNGKPGLLWTSDDLLAGTTVGNLLSVSAYTSYAVFKATAFNFNNPVIYNNGAIFRDNGGYTGMHMKQDNTLSAYHYSTTEHVATLNISTNVTYVAEMIYDGVNLVISVNNGTPASVAASNVAAAALSLTSTVGFGHIGYLHEIIRCNTALSADDRIAVMSYLMSKWGVS